MLEVGAGESEGELLPPVPGEDVAGAQALAPAAGELLEESIARLVAMCVVVLLEAVEVEDRHAEQCPAAIGSCQLASELLVPGAAVETARGIVPGRPDSSAARKAPPVG